MEDSPLSITANITGILTFIAAICAFVYVRYNTLRNGSTEIDSIVESVSATIEETWTISQAGLIVQPRDDHESIRLKTLMSELYSIELFILIECMQVYGKKFDMSEPASLPSEHTNAAWERVKQEIHEAKTKWQPRQRTNRIRAINNAFAAIDVLVNRRSSASILWSSVQILFHLGATPTMVRWYTVRKKVLEKIQQRDIIRSRLLFHQISVANSLVRNQETLVRSLIEGTDKLHSKLDRLDAFAVNTHEAMKKLKQDNSEIKDFIFRSMNSPKQQDKLQRKAPPETEEDD